MKKTYQSQEYDHAWENLWDDMKKYGPFARHLRRVVFNIIDGLSFNSVLDVGCGQGSFLQEFTNKYPHVQINGTDLSAKSIELAQSRIPTGTFHQLDLARSPIPAKFDLVICMEVLEHIEEDRMAIKHLAAMTGNYLLVSTPQGRMRSIEASYGHVRNYAPGELVAKFTEAGLDIERAVQWGFPFYSPLYRDFINLIKGSGTMGKYRLHQKVIAELVYGIFLLNSWKKGDELVILAKIPK